MNWYDKLKKYFPVEEMKSQQHMELLLTKKDGLYHKDEGEHHVMLYAESETFVFIDYLWVSSEARGQGIGKRIIEKMKKKNKPIILEVEPIDYDDSDTEKRLRFYSKLAFQHATSIQFNNHSFQTEEDAPLEILYWAPNEESEVYIFEQMKQIYQNIHSYEMEKLYGKMSIPVDKVLYYDENRRYDNLLNGLEK